MKLRKLPPIEVLRDYFDYNPETGDLRWKKRTHAKSRGRVGNIAGATDKKSGYHKLTFMGKRYLAHRICWALHYGVDPHPHLVDHLHGKEKGNAISNLRLVDHSVNALNSKLRINNTSTFRGVYYIKSRQKWGASINLGNRKRLFLGTFTLKEDAIKARLKAEADNNIFVRDTTP